jgi:hypothetical protein
MHRKIDVRVEGGRGTTFALQLELGPEHSIEYRAAARIPQGLLGAGETPIESL